MPTKSFDALFKELASKVAQNDQASATVAAVKAGIHEAGKKLLEEAGETWLAAEHESNEALAIEISQLLYRIQVLMLTRGISLEDIYRKL